MNIVYFTHLDGEKSAGLTYSIPAQICAQAKMDNVYWFNDIEKTIQYWEKIPIYHNRKEIKISKIRNFPKPFNNPDLVVFESFYSIKDCFVAKNLLKQKIPYIIIPRGALTKDAQKIKRYKKIIANPILFKSYAKNALSIQYLTKQEYKDSSDKWNKKNYILSNGITKKSITKEWKKKNYIKGVFIGRLAKFHKGLDLLIEACIKSREVMNQYNCSIDIYGPSKNDFEEIKKQINDNNLEDILILRGSIYDEDKEKVLLDSDFFVLTSRFEGHPMGLLEALAYGLPCLVTKGTNMKEEIKEYDSGWDCDNTADSISASLIAMVHDKALFPEKGNNAKKLAQKYEWDAIAQNTHTIYEGLINGRG